MRGASSIIRRGMYKVCCERDAHFAFLVNCISLDRLSKIQVSFELEFRLHRPPRYACCSGDPLVAAAISPMSPLEHLLHPGATRQRSQPSTYDTLGSFKTDRMAAVAVDPGIPSSPPHNAEPYPQTFLHGPPSTRSDRCLIQGYTLIVHSGRCS